MLSLRNETNGFVKMEPKGSQQSKQCVTQDIAVEGEKYKIKFCVIRRDHCTKVVQIQFDRVQEGGTHISSSRVID